MEVFFKALPLLKMSDVGTRVYRRQLINIKFKDGRL